MNELKNFINNKDKESETYKARINKLLSENNQLGDDMRVAQENLRLSASQIGKLQNEFKSVCDQCDDLKRKLAESDNAFKKYRTDFEQKIALLSQENERLNGVIEKKNG